MTISGVALLEEYRSLLEAGHSREAEDLILAHASEIRKRRQLAEPSTAEPTPQASAAEPQTVPPALRQWGLSGVQLWSPETMAFVVFMVALVVPYWRAFKYNSYLHGFHMDDVIAVQRNQDVVTPDWLDWRAFLRHDFWGLDMFSGEWTHKSYRPLCTLSFRWNFLAHGLNSSGFHVVNILLHFVNSFLVFALAKVGLRLSGSLAWLGAAIFAAHPVHTESLLYLVGRADVLCSVFFLGGILIYDYPFVTITAINNITTPITNITDLSTTPLRTTTRTQYKWVLLAYMLAILAGLSKELGLMLLPLYVLTDVMRGRFSRGLVTLGVTCFLFWLRHWYTDGTSLKMSVQDNPVSFEQDTLGRRLSYALIHGEYMRLLVFPRWLCYDYSLNTLPLVCDWGDLRLLSPLGAYSLLAWFVARFASAKDGAGLLLAAQFLLVFVPMSNLLFPVGTVVGERLLYIPSISFVLMIIRSLALTPLRSKGVVVLPDLVVSQSPVEVSRDLVVSKNSSHMVVGLMVMSLMLTMRCYERTIDWRSADILVNTDGAVNLRSSKTQFNLGVHHFSKKNYDLAFEALQRSWQSDPEQRDAIAFWRAGQVELLRGNLENAAELLTAATTKYGARLMVKEEEVFHDAGLANYHVGKVDKARYYLTAALTLNRHFPKALNNYGCMEYSAGNKEVALNAVFEAANLKVKNVIYWGNVWTIAGKLGLADIAGVAKEKALMIQPDFRPNDWCTWEFKPASGGPGVVDDDLAEEEELTRLQAAKDAGF